MRYITLLFALMFINAQLFAQTETFDIVTYQPPAGWKKTTTDFAVSYTITDNASGNWCQMAIYKSVPGSGVPSTDFSSEWKSLVKPETYTGAVEPKPIASQADGWTRNVGTSPFKWQGKESAITVINFSGGGLMLSVLISTNTTKYIADIEKFSKSIQPKPIAAPAAVATTTTTTNNNSNNTPITVTSSPGNSGIIVSTTNFDDGWMSQPFADYVLVTKKPVNVMLHYAIAIDDNMRQVGNMSVALWDRLITSRYKVSNVKVFKNEPYTYNNVWFVEADAIELQSNKPCYVALRVLVSNGIAYPIEIMTPDMASLQKEFPDQSKVESMMNYNKFAVSAKDLVGVWEESSSTGVNMYNSVTGAYAGMNTSSMANSYEFRADGSYHSNHKGAYGMVGSQTFYDEKYDGKYTLTTWDVTMTNRFKGKTDVFWCEYEAVRGGRVLKLVQKDATGMRYHLVKKK